MADMFPVFFEARELTDLEKEKIQKYFTIRRRSRGGDCRPLEKVGPTTYKIAFLEKEVQQRVLALGKHNIPLPCGEELEINTKQNATCKQDSSSFSHHQPVTTERNDEVKYLIMDQYLIQYLQDNPNANRDLGQRLATLCTSCQVLPEKGRVVVKRGTAQPALTQAQWEAQVDHVGSQIQQKYCCYFEVDAARSRTLHENPFMRCENLHVYKEGEDTHLAVVVGEHDEVERMLQRLVFLHVNQLHRRDTGISLQQFAVVEQDFEQEMKASFPHINITRQETVTLEGPKTEVEAACATIEQLVKSIRQRRLQLSAPLIAFLQSSGAIQTYQRRFQQSLRSPVMLEAGPDLILSSLTSESLEEAATALERDLTVEEVILEQAEAESSGMVTLQEVLSETAQQANYESLKVQLSNGQPSVVDRRILLQLVGYRKEVDRLKGVVLDYKLNQADIHDSLNLPYAVVADHLPRVLELLEVQHSGLSLIPTMSPLPAVHFAGPRQLVQDFREALTSAFASLVCTECSVEGPGVTQYFKGEEGQNSIALLELSHKVLIVLSDVKNQGGATGSEHSSHISLASLITACKKAGHLTTDKPSLPIQLEHASLLTASSMAKSRSPPNKIQLEVELGHLEVQQVDVLVAPMVKTDLLSLSIGRALMNAGGQYFKHNFCQAIRPHSAVQPGDIVQVEGSGALRCRKVFFLECLPWDASLGNSEKVLRCGLRQALVLCEKQAFTSVAFPLIGPGLVLRIPNKEAIHILTSEIGLFGLHRQTNSLSNIRIVIHSDYPRSKEICQDVCSGLNLHMMDSKGQAVFQCPQSEPTEKVLTVGTKAHLVVLHCLSNLPLVGTLKVHLVSGDITNETTDVIVNSTDFKTFDTGICKSILAVAGSKVKKSLKSACIKKGEVFTSAPGSFPCKAIMHVCGERDPALIQDLCREILLLCESKGYQSVAIPAICAAAGVDARVVADAILCGVVAAASDSPFQHLSSVRLVLFSMPVFLQFRAAADAMFGTPPPPKPPTPPPRRTSTAPVKSSTLNQPLYLNIFSPSSPLPPPPPTPSILTATTPSATFTLLGTSEEDLSDACASLQWVYTSHCSQRTLTPEELAGLSQEEVADLEEKVLNLRVQLEAPGSGSGYGGPGAGVVVKGLSEGVNDVMHVVQASLGRRVAEREQRELFAHVVWCIMGQRGDWERLPKEANQKLERGDVSGGVMDAQGCQWNVNLQQMRATAALSGQTTSLKRLKNLPDFTIPLYWDSMVLGEVFQLVSLFPCSAEFERIKADFRRTCLKTVLKIERVQNVHLRRAYEVLRQQLDEKNRPPVGAGEKMLYHGTTHHNCQAIMKNGFNRRFAGQNGAVYGLGTYFAVNAGHSANPTYSCPRTDGTQLMFVARVLTGRYTLGRSDMRVPPPVSDQQPHILFDSLVDSQQSPSMFVVFHDSQAYPDYLITFK
ncbi:protein mono-ADP-ribosyltransferase PARP14-like [Engraulis encrasicolus]|uniref:protein mono-ADP-ribosyltransferase PARP14-like n=1 Tax=Engraulis encrasicolus TaxID=184585 RepID=UPI002FCEE218